MRALKVIGSSIKNIMILFSFVVNLVLVLVLIFLGLQIFEIKQNIALPLLSGLHSSFVGLDQAVIDYTIPVRADVPVNLDIALQQNTVVVLTEAVPLNVTANINLPGIGNLNNANVALTLPAGTRLPVALDLIVPVRDSLPIALDVRAVIPLRETQLTDPFQNLKLMFEPLAVMLYNLPDGFEEVPAFIGDVLDGDGLNLLAENAYSRAPWPGFSRTAGLGYTLGNEEIPPANLPIETGIVPIGGIPLLDQQLRPQIYAQGGPVTVNAQAVTMLEAQAIPAASYEGSDVAIEVRTEGAPEAQPPQPEPAQGAPTADMGIVPTPGSPEG
jgi:hypothetical protein